LNEAVGVVVDCGGTVVGAVVAVVGRVVAFDVPAVDVVSGLVVEVGLLKPNEVPACMELSF